MIKSIMTNLNPRSMSVWKYRRRETTDGLPARPWSVSCGFLDQDIASCLLSKDFSIWCFWDIFRIIKCDPWNPFILIITGCVVRWNGQSTKTRWVSSGPLLGVPMKAPLRFNIATVSPVQICWTDWNERVATWKTLDPFWPMPEWQVKILSYVFFLVTNSLGLLWSPDLHGSASHQHLQQNWVLWLHRYCWLNLHKCWFCLQSPGWCNSACFVHAHSSKTGYLKHEW